VFLCALTLLTLGVVMVQSAGMSVDPVEQVPVGLMPVPRDSDAHSFAAVLTHLLTARSTIYMALAVLAMSAVSLMPVRRLAAAMGSGSGFGVLALGSLVMLAVLSTSYVPGLGREVNGSQRWISLPLPGLRATSVQPSELVKWGLVVVLAVYCARRAAAMPSFFRGLLPGLIGVGLVAGAVAKEDLGTGVLIASAGGLVLIAAGARLWHFAMFIPPALAGFIFLVASNPTAWTAFAASSIPTWIPRGPATT
jgi:cell division protein FtsW (lipid II flippase)